MPFIQQNTASDCGAASLAMVLAYHGKHLRLDDVRKVTGFGRDGADALAILSAARVFGLRGRGVKVEEVDDLKYLPQGSILHWQFNHFLVFERLTPEGADLVDPAGGRRSVSRDELGRSFTGVALTFEEGEDFEPQEGEPRRWGRFLKLLREQGGVLQRVVVTSAMVQLFALAVPLLIGSLVDRVIPRGDVQLLAVLGGGLAAIVGFSFLASLLRSFLLLYMRTHLDARMTLDFLDHLVDLPYAFFQQRSAGDLIMRMGSNATVREILTSGALSGVLDGLMVTLYLVLLLAASPTLGLLVVLLGGFRIGLFLFTRSKTRDLMSRSLQTEARSQSYQVNLLAGIETLKAAGAEHRSVEQWSHLYVDVLNVSLARGRLQAFVDSILSALATASPLVILIWGGVQVLDGHLTLGTMLALNALAAGFLTPLSTLITNAFQFQLLGSYMDRLEDVLETPREQDPATVKPAGRLKGGISSTTSASATARTRRWRSRRSRSTCRRGASWRWSAARERGSRRWRACWSGSIRRARGASCSTASTSRSSSSARCAGRSGWCRSTRTSSAPASGRTSPSPTPPCRCRAPWKRGSSPTSTTTSWRCRWATRRSWPTAAPRSRAASGSVWRSPAPSSTGPPSSSSTRRRARSTPAPSGRSRGSSRPCAPPAS